MLGNEVRRVVASKVVVGTELYRHGRVSEVQVNGENGVFFDAWLPEGWLRLVTATGAVDADPLGTISAWVDVR